MIFDGEALLPPMRVLATHSSGGMMCFSTSSASASSPSRCMSSTIRWLAKTMSSLARCSQCDRSPSVPCQSAPSRALVMIGMTRAEGDELARGQSPMARERFEDVADVGVGDANALRRDAARKMRAAFVIGAGSIREEIVERIGL